MSINKNLIQPLIKRLEKTTFIRDKVKKAPGQVLLLRDLKTFESLFKKANLNLDSGQQEKVKAIFEKALKLAKIKAAALELEYKGRHKEQYKDFYKRIIKQINWKDGEPKKTSNPQTSEIFLIQQYSGAETVRKVILDTLKLELNEVLKSFDFDETFRNQEQKGGKLGAIRAHIAHGEQGLAVTQVAAAKAFARVQEYAGGTDALVNAVMSEIESRQKKGARSLNSSRAEKFKDLVNELKLSYKTIVDSRGRIRGEYFSILTFQESSGNLSEGGAEKQFLNIVKDALNSKEFLQNLVTMRTSPSILDRVEGVIIQELVLELTKAKNLKLNLSITKNKGGTTKGSAKQKYKEKRKKQAVQATEAAVFAKGAQAEATKRSNKKKPTPKKGASSVPLAAINEMNRRLPEVVRGNMKSPRLINRTGRFSESVRILDINTTAQGFPSIGYTYQTEPYRVFETTSGSRFASYDRDPRRLIDTSIRDLAVEYALGRFYTRRVL